jgi:hypothetical protein
MRRIMNSKFAAPLVIIGLLIVVIFVLVIRWQGSPDGTGAGPAQTRHNDEAVGPTEPAATQEPRPAAWTRPTTVDPRAFAIAFGTTIWTYDSAAHSYVQWQDAVTAYANPLESPEGGRVARSMLPYASQWEELRVHNAHASTRDVTAGTTPELDALARDPRAPAGWHGFVVRGTQESVLDGETTKAERHMTVSVICRPRCTFWSASNELPR